MTADVAQRWNDVSSKQNALLEPSPFGLHEDRQDFRGFHWQSASVDERLLRRRNSAAHIDLSHAHIKQWAADNIAIDDVVCHAGHLPGLHFFRSTLTDCHFANCDMSSNIQSIFGKLGLPANRGHVVELPSG